LEWKGQKRPDGPWQNLVFSNFIVDIGSPVFSIIILWLQSTGKEKREEEVGCIMGESKTEKIKI